LREALGAESESGNRMPHSKSWREFERALLPREFLSVLHGKQAEA
jgi:hypothetical protein